MKKTPTIVIAIVAISLVLGMILSGSALAAGSWTDQPSVSLYASTHVISSPHLVMFSGRISADHKECKVGRPVSMYTGANGVGFVGSTVSGSHGRFSIPAFVDRNHTFHVEVAGKTTTVHPDTQVCNDASSNFWIVRVKNKG